MSTTPRSAPSSSAAKVQSAPAFLEKLYEILSDSSNGPYISWQADGTAFLIKKVSELQEIVLPKYFKHNNLQSFVRQLNMYNFAKTCHDPNYREFRNTHFIRGRRDLLPLIRRKAQSSVRELGINSTYTGPLSGRSASATQSECMDVDDDGEAAEDAGTSGFRTSHRKRTSTYKVAQSSYTRSQQSTREVQDASDYWEDTYSAGGSAYDDGAYTGMQQANDDYSSLVTTTDDLRWRIRQLETTNTLLMERYTGLASKHDELCNLLHKLLPLENSSRSSTSSQGAVTSGDSPPLSVSLDALLDSRVNWTDTTVRRRRAYSDISTGGAESVQTAESGATSAGSCGQNRRGVGSFDSTGSRFPDTDSDHASAGSESDGMLGLRKSGSPPEADKKPKPEKEANGTNNEVAKTLCNASDEATSVTMADICDSPTYAAANILVHSIHSNRQGPTKDNGLSNFVEAISTMWHNKNNHNTSIGLNKNTQMNRVSVLTNAATQGFSALASPIQVSHPKKGLVQSPLADHGVGVGGGYGTLAGKPISKQVSMPAASVSEHNLSGKKQKTAHDEPLLAVHGSDNRSAIDTVAKEEAANQTRELAGEAISRQNTA